MRPLFHFLGAESNGKIFFYFALFDFFSHPFGHATATGPRIFGIFGVAIFDLCLRPLYRFALAHRLDFLNQLSDRKTGFLGNGLNFLFGFSLRFTLALFQFPIDIPTHFGKVSPG